METRSVKGAKVTKQRRVKIRRPDFELKKLASKKSAGSPTFAAQIQT